MSEPGPIANRADLGQQLVLPSLFRSADAASGRGQRAFLLLTALDLGALLVAAAVGPYSHKVFAHSADVFGLIAVVAFVGALTLKSYSLATSPEKSWYGGRALAESVKTLAWRYAVAADPFPKGAENADELLIERLEELIVGVQDVNLEPELLAGDQITEHMRFVRGTSLEQRRAFYRLYRIEDQRHWYADRARKHGRRARNFGVLSLASDCYGTTMAVLKAVLVLNVGLLSFVAALGSGLVAWERSHQDTMLAKAYSVAAHELSLIEGLIEHQDTDEKWSQFVTKAEEAISREHTLWQASRSK